MRKSILTLLAILMILSMAVSVMATTDGGSAAVSTAAGKPGETVYLTVSLTDVADATSIGVSVEGLPVVGAHWVKEGTMKEFVLADNIGAWASERAVSVNGDVLDLAFKVPESDGTEKDYPVQVTIQVLNGSELLLSSTVSGKVCHHVAATDVTLSKTSLSIDIAGEKTAELTASVSPADHNETLVWTSDNEAVATVSDGVVTAHKVGTANITVTAGNVSSTCAVTVTCAHTNAVKVSAKEATCKTTGNKEHWSCGDCGQLLEQDKKTVTTAEAQQVPVLDHTYAKWESNEAQHWRACTVCGNTDSAENHAYTWKTDKEPTENKTGLKHEECVCGLKRSENTVIEKLEHTHTGITYHEKVTATCIATGVAEHWTCGSEKCAGKFYADKDCKTELESVTVAVDPANHTGSTEVRNTAEPTCEEDGYTGDTCCADCGAILTSGEAIEKKGHDFHWIVDKHPSEWHEGAKHEQCSRCNTERNQNTVIEKLEHTHTGITYHEKVTATCIATGVAEHWTCGSEKCAGKFYADKDCKTELETVTVAVDPANHTGSTEVRNTAEPTCEEDGYTGDTCCADCGAILKSGEAIEKKGHDFRWIVDKYPSEWREGAKHEQCSRCNTERNQNTVIGKLIHNPKRVDGVAPTCLEGGVAEHFYCANCGTYYAVADGMIGEEISEEDTILPAAGHQFGEEWQQDEKDHWKVCACGELSEKEAHTLELKGAVEATETEEGYTGDQVCSVCQYVAEKGESIPCLDVEETTEATSVEEPKDEGSSPVGGIIAIVIGVIAVSGGAIFLGVKKFKKN